MKSRGERLLVVLLVCGSAGGFAALVAVGAWTGWQKALARHEAEDTARRDAERAADRAEAAAAFAAPVPPAPGEAAEFRRTFDRLGAALARGDEPAVTGVFDAERLADQLVRSGAFRKLPGGHMSAFRAGVVKGIRGAGLGRSLLENEQFRWDRTEIRRVRWSADRQEAVVISVHRGEVGGEESRLKMRWWLVARGGGWRVFDLEDLDVSWRLSHLIGVMATPEVMAEMETNPRRLRGAVEDLRTAISAIIVRKDVDEAEQALARCQGMALPDPLAAMRKLIEGCILLQRGDSAGALLGFGEAERLLPGMPVLKLCRAAAFSLNGRFEDALASARDYTAELGPDAIACGHEAAALEGLGRTAEAADAFRKVLDESPDEVTAFQGLRRTLPAGAKAELGDRLARANKVEELFDSLLTDAREDGDEAAAKALINGLRTARPDAPRAAAEDLRELVKAGNYPAAATAVRGRLAGPKRGPDQTQILNAYLFAMLGAKRSTDAYAAVPDGFAAEAFRTLADHLADEIDDATPESPAPEGEQLKKLIAAHREREPADAWLWYYEAAIHQAGGEYEKAEKLLAAGAAKLSRRAGPDETDGPDEADRFRYRRVQCLYALKQGLRAYAEVGPVAATFHQLADKYDEDHDVAGLTALVAAHAEKTPVDAAVTFWRAEVRYMKGEYGAAATGFAAYRRASGEKNAEQFRTTDRQLRSLIRAGDAAGARRVLAEIGKDRVPVGLQAAVAAAADDPAPLDQLMGEQAKTVGGCGFLYDDEDFARLIAAPRFAELRKKYPDPRPKKPAGPVS